MTVNLVSIDVNFFCADPVALMGFYQALLGLTEVEASRSPIYRALRLGETEFGFNKTDAYPVLNLADRVPGDKGVKAYPTFVVPQEPDIDALAAKVTSLGGKIIKPPYRTYYGAWQVVAEDIEGNVFRLNCRPA